jgi:hypothetical protein
VQQRGDVPAVAFVGEEADVDTQAAPVEGADDAVDAARKLAQYREAGWPVRRWRSGEGIPA